MSSIFQISGWDAGQQYIVDDVVYVDASGTRNYYYSLDSNLNQNPQSTSSWTSDFLWQPSYTTNAAINFNTVEAKFGDGYAQKVSQNLDFTQLTLNLVYNNIDRKTVYAISHFLFEKKGVNSFLFVPGTNAINQTDLHFIASAPRIRHDNYRNYSLETSLTMMRSLALPTSAITVDTGSLPTAGETTPPVDCGSTQNAGGWLGITPSRTPINPFLSGGNVVFSYNSFSVPDRFVIYKNLTQIFDSQYVGSAAYDSQLAASGLPPVVGPGAGTFVFSVTTSDSVVVDTYAPLAGTAWTWTFPCPTGG